MAETVKAKALEQVQAVFTEHINSVKYHHGDDFLVIEARFLPVFAPLSPVAVPKYSLRGEGFTGYRKLRGTWLTRHALEALPEEAQTRIARQIGGFLTALHGFPTETARQMGMTEGWGGWREAANQRFRDDVLVRLSIPTRKNALSCLEAYAAHKFEPVVVHGDLYPSYHILLDPERGEISGVIDFGDLTLEDPTMDLKSLLAELGKATFRRILEHYDQETGEGLIPFLEIANQATVLLEAVYDLQFGYPGRLADHLRRIEKLFGR